MSRAKRIRELMIDEGMTRREAIAWVDFEGDYKPENKQIHRPAQCESAKNA